MRPGSSFFAHGSGSSRHSRRNQRVAEVIRSGTIGTLLFDLLTYTRHLTFDIGLLADRLVAGTRWLKGSDAAANLPVGYFGASTGGGAALVAAAELGSDIGAVVSRGGRPDLAGDALASVTAPTLLLVGELDGPVIELNEAALSRLRCEKKLQIVPRATHLFEEPGTLDQVARSATDWFKTYLRPSARSSTAG